MSESLAHNRGAACKCPERNKPLALRNWTVRSWHPYKVYGPNASSYRDRLLLDVTCEECKGWVRNKNPTAPIWDLLPATAFDTGAHPFTYNLAALTIQIIPDASVLFDPEDIKALGYRDFATIHNPDALGGFYYSIVTLDEHSFTFTRDELAAFIFEQGYEARKLTGEDLAALFTLCADHYRFAD
jgi:hypothetical protein